MIKKLTFDLYPLTLYLIIDETNENIIDFVLKEGSRYPDDTLALEEPAYACFDYAKIPHSDIYLRIKDLREPQYVAHEIFHAAVYIMKYIGCRLTDSSEEAYAYLVQYITDNIYD